VKLALVGFEATETNRKAADRKFADFAQIWVTDRTDQFPASRPGTISWWRRGDSTFHGFRHGLDYAFIRAPLKSVWMRSVLFVTTISSRILVPAPAYRLGESMSLYRAGLKLAFFLPLGVAMPLIKERRQVSPM
jgi:hypothetical protein